MTVEEAIDYVCDVARKAPVPADVHDNCEQIRRELKQAASKQDVPATNRHVPEGLDQQTITSAD